MDLFRRLFSWLRGDNIIGPERSIANETTQAVNGDADNPNSSPPPPAEGTCSHCQAQNLQMIIYMDAFRAITTALEARVDASNERVISKIDELSRDMENLRRDMRSNSSHQVRDQVFAISQNYVHEHQETIPVEFVHEAATVQENGNESPAMVNEEVSSQQNRNQALNVSDQEPGGQSAQPPSQEVSRMPAQPNTIRINNNITVAQCYKMDHKNRGLCLIFSHMLFRNTTLTQRTSAPKEAIMIQNTFDRKGFRVLKFEDYTYDKIRRQLRKLESLVNDDDDCICICISTHGFEGVLWALDSAYSIDIFENALARIRKLKGKPKLMFIQACRGAKVDRGIPLNQATSDSEDQSDNAINFTRYPTWADFLIVHSTPYGYVSWRNWFFQALCKNLDMYGEKDDMDEILRKTARKICENESRCHDKTRDRAKQISVIYSTLTKRLFLKRK